MLSALVLRDELFLLDVLLSAHDNLTNGAKDDNGLSDAAASGMRKVLEEIARVTCDV